MKIEAILEEWSKDSVIDDLNLDTEANKVPGLHSKYLTMLSNERSTFTSLGFQKRTLSQLLNAYYMGISTQEDLANLGRTPYLHRVLKNEVDSYIAADDKMINLDAKLAMQKEKIDVLMDCVKAISNRSYNFQNAIAWRRLMVGG